MMSLQTIKLLLKANEITNAWYTLFLCIIFFDFYKLNYNIDYKNNIFKAYNSH